MNKLTRESEYMWESKGGGGKNLCFACHKCFVLRHLWRFTHALIQPVFCAWKLKVKAIVVRVDQTKWFRSIIKYPNSFEVLKEEFGIIISFWSYSFLCFQDLIIFTTILSFPSFVVIQDFTHCWATLFSLSKFSNFFCC